MKEIAFKISKWEILGRTQLRQELVNMKTVLENLL